MHATKLEKLFIGEISGVDDPANQSPGWVVMKAEGAPEGALVVVPGDAADEAATTTIKDRLKGWVLGKEDLQVDKSELTAILDERDESLVAKVVEAVSKSVDTPVVAPVEEPVAPVVAAPVIAEATLTVEDVVKAIEVGLEPYNEILEKVLDRLEKAEGALTKGARTSIDGQEGSTASDGEPEAPKLGDAIAKALRNPGSTVRMGGADA
jgi:hypothetical protein